VVLLACGVQFVPPLLVWVIPPPKPTAHPRLASRKSMSWMEKLFVC
jgi:hypothetical protein